MRVFYDLLIMNIPGPIISSDATHRLRAVCRVVMEILEEIGAMKGQHVLELQETTIRFLSHTYFFDRQDRAL